MFGIKDQKAGNTCKLSAYHLNTLFHYSPISSKIHRVGFRTFWLKFPLLLALKDGKSGHTLIHNREMKGNGFDPGLTSQANFKELSQCKAVCDVNPVSYPFPFIVRLVTKVWPLFPSFKASEKVNFQSKCSKNNTTYLGPFRRIIKVETCAEVICT